MDRTEGYEMYWMPQPHGDVRGPGTGVGSIRSPRVGAAIELDPAGPCSGSREAEPIDPGHHLGRNGETSRSKGTPCKRIRRGPFRARPASDAAMSTEPAIDAYRSIGMFRRMFPWHHRSSRACPPNSPIES